MSKFLKIAFKIAAQSPHPHHKMAAVVVKGGAIISSAPNIGRWGHCCERRALRPNMDYKGATLYVVRSNRRISKPCEACWKLIKESGIKSVVFVNIDAKIEKVRV